LHQVFLFSIFQSAPFIYPTPPIIRQNGVQSKIVRKVFSEKVFVWGKCVFLPTPPKPLSSQPDRSRTWPHSSFTHTDILRGLEACRLDFRADAPTTGGSSCGTPHDCEAYRSATDQPMAALNAARKAGARSVYPRPVRFLWCTQIFSDKVEVIFLLVTSHLK
jgi:hypothetical protein